MHADMGMDPFLPGPFAWLGVGGYNAGRGGYSSSSVGTVMSWWSSARAGFPAVGLAALRA